MSNPAAQTDARASAVLCKSQSARAAGCERWATKEMHLQVTFIVVALLAALPSAATAADACGLRDDTFAPALMINCRKEQSGQQLFACLNERFKSMDHKVAAVPPAVANELSKQRNAAEDKDDYAALDRLHTRPEYSAWSLHESLRLAQDSTDASKRSSWGHTGVAKTAITLLSSLRTLQSEIETYAESALKQQAASKKVDLSMKLTKDFAALQEDLRYTDGALSLYLTCVVDPR